MQLLEQAGFGQATGVTSSIHHTRETAYMAQLAAPSNQAHVRVSKRKGSPPDLDEPVILSEIRRGTTVKSLCNNISSELLRDFNYALVWGIRAKHATQRGKLLHHAVQRIYSIVPMLTPC